MDIPIETFIFFGGGRTYGGFHKWGGPKIDGFIRDNPSINGWSGTLLWDAPRIKAVEMSCGFFFSFVSGVGGTGGASWRAGNEWKCRLTPAEFRKETIWHVDTHIDPAEKMGAPKFDGFLIVFFSD